VPDLRVLAPVPAQTGGGRAEAAAHPHGAPACPACVRVYVIGYTYDEQACAPLGETRCLPTCTILCSVLCACTHVCSWLRKWQALNSSSSHHHRHGAESSAVLGCAFVCSWLRKWQVFVSSVAYVVYMITTMLLIHLRCCVHSACLQLAAQVAGVWIWQIT
jgi:hypothetical protein